MAKTDTQLANAMITAYQNLYVKKYGLKPIVNRYRDKWGMLDVLQEMDYGQALTVLEYFFKLNMTHTLQNFYINFDRIVDAMRAREREAKHRAAVLKQTREMMKEINE